ncbi:hypothetical protein GQ85_17705 [Rhodococcus rhodochrous]|nr:hypothetical protein GQ85_17705 [Rhodococcus rhodochrous]
MAARAVSTVQLEAADAALLVRLIDELGAMVRQTGNGRALSPKVMTLRDDLATAGARVSGRAANVSRNVSPVGGQDISDQSDIHALIDTAQAAAVLGITPGGVRDLARRKRIAARRAGGRWVFSLLDVERIAAERARGLRR